MHPLLVALNAKYIHTNTAVRLLKANASHHIDFMEFTIKDNVETIVKTIIDKNPLFVGFSVYIWNVTLTQTIIHTLKEKADIPIILGGPEVSYDAAHFLDHWPIDGVIKGEGEKSMDALVAHYSEGAPLEKVPNLSADGIENPIEEIENLHQLASPHFLDESHASPVTRIVYIESARGCPYRCSYCLSSLEKTVRFFKLTDVFDNIAHELNRGAKTFKFLDRTFNANSDALKIIDYIIENHTPGSVFQFEMTGDTLSHTLIDHIHTHAPKGLFRFEIGIQSTHTKTNLLVGRRQDNEKLFRVIKDIIQHDIIALHLDLIAGLPAEDLSRFKQTFNDVYALGAKELQLGFLKMLRGTMIRHQADVYDYDYDKQAPYEIRSNHVLSKDDVTTIKNVEEMLEIFHNKGYFNHTLFSIITSHTNDYFDFFKRLHRSFHAKGHERIGYQIDTLYRFISDFLYQEGIHSDHIDMLKIPFLKHFKTKPKPYFEKITDKPLRKTILSHVAKTYNLDAAALFKHTLIAPYQGQYLVAYYNGTHATLYEYKKRPN